MKRASILMAFACGAVLAFADPAPVFVEPRPVVTIRGLSEADVGRYDGPGDTILQGLATKDGRFYFPLQYGFLVQLDGAFVIRDKKMVLSGYTYFDAMIRICSGDVVGLWYDNGTLEVYAVRGSLVYQRTMIDPSLRYVLALSDVIIFRADVPGIRYVAFAVNPDGSVRRMEHAEALFYLPRNVPGVTVKDGVIYYKGNGLTSDLINIQVDDDGNFYTARTVYRDDDPRYTIHSSTDQYDDYKPWFFDGEGNFWAMDFTDDAARSLVLLYAGRDWGYRESPRRAVPTESGLHIRLRASGDALILGTLVKDQSITILKTGALATIGGVTAAWYRIKTADGLVGWTFGGYIKILE